MPILNYTTGTSVDSTVTKIMKRLAAFGARQIAVTYGSDGVAEALTFQAELLRGTGSWEAFQMPVRVEGVASALRRQKVDKRYLKPDHVQKVAWRIAEDWLKAQLALVEAQMVELGEVFFPYVVVDRNERGRMITSFEKFIDSKAMKGLED